MKARRRFRQVKRTDVLRQSRAQRMEQFVRRQIRFRAKRRGLRPRVHARVRPAGAGHLDRLRQNVTQRGFELFLNRVVRVALPLPAVVAAAVVAQGHAEVRHRLALRSVFSIVPQPPRVCNPAARVINCSH